MANKTAIAPAYLLLGPELGDKDARIAAIKSAIAHQQGSEPEVHRFYPYETEQGEIFSVLQNNSLFADYRLVILNKAEDCPIQLTAALVEYLKHPSGSATLLLVSDETSLNAKLSAVVPKDRTEIFWEMFENRKSQWVRDLFHSSGYDIEDDAAELLLDLVENNTRELRDTAGQLIQFISTDPSRQTKVVTEEDIESYVHHSRQESAFTLFEAIATASLEKALGILHVLQGSAEGESVPLLAVILWQFRRLASYTQELARGMSHEESCRTTTVLGKPAPIKRKKDQTMVSQAARRFPLDRIGPIIARIAEYDLRIREASADLQLLLLEQFLYVVMVRKGSPANQAQFPSLLRDARF